MVLSVGLECLCESFRAPPDIGQHARCCSAACTFCSVTIPVATQRLVLCTAYYCATDIPSMCCCCTTSDLTAFRQSGTCAISLRLHMSPLGRCGRQQHTLWAMVMIVLPALPPDLCMHSSSTAVSVTATPARAVCMYRRYRSLESKLGHATGCSIRRWPFTALRQFVNHCQLAVCAYFVLEMSKYDHRHIAKQPALA